MSRPSVLSCLLLAMATLCVEVVRTADLPAVELV